MSRKALALTAAGVLLLGGAFLVTRSMQAYAADGQGPVDDNVEISGARLGTHWYGAEINKDDLRGKVVLIEQWGS